MKKSSSFDRTTLLLDYGWTPIGVLTARATFKHFIKNRIVGLDKDKNSFAFSDWYEGYANLYSDQPCMSSSRELWPLPTIAVVTEKFFRKFERKAHSFRQLCVFYDFTCQICLDRFPPSQLSIEHVKPRSKGGSNETENKTITCRRCNCRKSNKFPYNNVEGQALKGTQIPANYIFIEKSVMRDEWKDFLNYK